MQDFPLRFYCLLVSSLFFCLTFHSSFLWIFCEVHLWKFLLNGWRYRANPALQTPWEYFHKKLDMSQNECFYLTWLWVCISIPFDFPVLTTAKLLLGVKKEKKKYSNCYRSEKTSHVCTSKYWKYMIWLRLFAVIQQVLAGTKKFWCHLHSNKDRKKNANRSIS